eukprot:714185-Rhodomonas_salina.1
MLALYSDSMIVAGPRQIPAATSQTSILVPQRRLHTVKRSSPLTKRPEVGGTSMSSVACKARREGLVEGGGYLDDGDVAVDARVADRVGVGQGGVQKLLLLVEHRAPSLQPNGSSRSADTNRRKVQRLAWFLPPRIAGPRPRLVVSQSRRLTGTGWGPRLADSRVSARAVRPTTARKTRQPQAQHSLHHIHQARGGLY